MKILFISLGCEKNRVETEYMLGILAEHGYEFTDDAQSAEAAVINTCCFINDAKQESIDTILELAELRKSGKLRALIVAGCLGQRYKEEIQKEIPEVDSILGTTAFDKIVEALDEVLKGQVQNYFESIDRKPVTYNRILSTGTAYSYLKIAEGCNKNCTYCIIPKVRGHYRSVPMEDLIKEAEELAYNGIKELIIVAQETTVYGVDLYGKKMLPELLTKLCRIEGFEWIRIMYCYPEEITDELIEVMKKEPKICHYLDLPIQSGSDAILRKMGRRTDNADIRRIVEKLRSEIPDICLRTTLISGFPGETADDHNQTMKLISDLRFDRLGVFTYSPEEDTVAAAMEDQVPERTKKTRRTKLMKMQQEFAFEGARKMVGRKLKAIIEGRIGDEDPDTDDQGRPLYTYVARTYKDSPDIDGFLFIENVPYDLMSGKFVDVMITGSDEYDLIGELAE
ncbi:30S ribosomal protein S12 methylthiotransferase RimO [Butyrivibrio fibrisolvens]|jgi:ribosomal protein S12 methylthiotransferase|uniref:30S ribosomal protein S12 methylthiotransferase RimO n=1 Tax=Butyrivibrio fibrisolvens TaxID=831 RepID=UPI0003B3F2B6|nr:30S ribosomal protein S12 methylthiotransferase RimO [Butyrivibrio fibrisolvens]MBQ1458701.1 30S ribosomal protein S12 methylthiotransferase RimO [Butyrivibrio sp.]